MPGSLTVLALVVFARARVQVVWEVIQLHHTKLTAIAHFPDTKAVPPQVQSKQPQPKPKPKHTGSPYHSPLPPPPTQTLIKMMTNQPTILEKVYHAAIHASASTLAPTTAAAAATGQATGEEKPLLASTTHSFILPDTYPFEGGGDAKDGVLIHLAFPSAVKDIAHYNLSSPVFECKVPIKEDGVGGVGGVEGSEAAMSPPPPAAAITPTPAAKTTTKIAAPEPEAVKTAPEYETEEEVEEEAVPVEEPEVEVEEAIGDPHEGEEEEEEVMMTESEADQAAATEEEGEGSSHGGEEEGESDDESDLAAFNKWAAADLTNSAAPAPPGKRVNFGKVGLLLGASCLLIGGGLLLLRMFSSEHSRETKRRQRKRVIAEAEEADPELLPEIKQVDVEVAEAAGTVKVHVELPNGEIVSFRVKKRYACMQAQPSPPSPLQHTRTHTAPPLTHPLPFPSHTTQALRHFLRRVMWCRPEGRPSQVVNGSTAGEYGDAI